MSVLEFIVALIDSLAWPLAVVVLFVLFRGQIVALLSLLRRIKYGDLDVYFSEQLEEVESQVQSIPTGNQVPEVDDRIREVVRISPRLAIIESWLAVEAAMTALSDVGSPNPARSHGRMSSLERILEEAGVIDATVAALIASLRIIRNKAVHISDFQVSEVTALRFASVASTVVDLLPARE